MSGEQMDTISDTDQEKNYGGQDEKNTEGLIPGIETVEAPVKNKDLTTDTNADTKETDFTMKNTENCGYIEIPGLIISEFDTREYSMIKLENEMHILCISDKTTKMSGCVIKMGVGSVEDPVEFPGLAHFLEHMLFLGSKKYPDPLEYDQCFIKYGGSSDADTGDHETRFMFECSNEGFQEVLDRTSDFFKNPQFNEECAENEINAVNSEFLIDLQDDDQRHAEVLSRCSNPDSFYSRFSMGNNETLRKPGIKQALLDFHSKYYSSNLSFAALFSNQPIETQKNQAVEKFSGVENKNLPKTSYKDWPVPYGPDQNQKLIKIDNVDSSQDLTFYFNLPYYNCNLEPTLDYIARLFNHVCKGSLYYELFELGYCTELTAEYNNIGIDNSSQFSIDVTLTEDGFNKYEKVISVIASYLKFLRKTEPEKWLHDEMSYAFNVDFKYKQKEESWDYLDTITEDFGYYKMENLLYHAYNMDEFKPEIIKEQLNQMTCENSFITLAENDITLPKKNTKTEKYYKVRYSSANYSNALKKIMDGDNYEPKIPFSYPTKNMFLPKNFEQLCETDSVLKDIKFTIPEKIKSDSECDIWYKPDVQFKEPRVNFRLEIYHDSNSKMKNATQIFYFNVWSDMLAIHLAKEKDFAEAASCDLDMEVSEYSISLEINCFNDTLEPFVGELCKKIEKFSEDFQEKNFKELVINVGGKFNNDEESPEDQATYYFENLMITNSMCNDYVNDVEDNIKLKDFKEFCKNGIWDKLFFQAYFGGNISETKCIKIYDRIRDSLYAFKSFEPLNRKDIVQLPVSNFAKNTVRIFSRFVENEDEENSAILKYYQLEPILDDEKLYMNEILSISIVQHYLCYHFYGQLRTEQQLGYNVTSELEEHRGIFGIRFSVQGDVKEPNYMSLKITEFLEEYYEKFNEQTEEEFLQIKAAYENDNTCPSNNLSDDTYEMFWSQIYQYKSNWDYISKLIEDLKPITKEDCVKVYKKVLIDDKKILEVHMVAPKIKKIYSKSLAKRNFQIIKNVNKHQKNTRRAAGNKPWCSPCSVLVVMALLHQTQSFETKLKS